MASEGRSNRRQNGGFVNSAYILFQSVTLFPICVFILQRQKQRQSKNHFRFPSSVKWSLKVLQCALKVTVANFGISSMNQAIEHLFRPKYRAKITYGKP